MYVNYVYISIFLRQRKIKTRSPEFTRKRNYDPDGKSDPDLDIRGTWECYLIIIHHKSSIVDL